jgi:hypothetical protein
MRPDLMIAAPITMLRLHAESLRLKLHQLETVGLVIDPTSADSVVSSTRVAPRFDCGFADSSFSSFQRRADGLYWKSGSIDDPTVKTWYSALRSAMADVDLGAFQITASAADLLNASAATLPAAALADLAALILWSGRREEGPLLGGVNFMIDRRCSPDFHLVCHRGSALWPRRWMAFHRDHWMAGIERIVFRFNIRPASSAHASLATLARAVQARKSLATTPVADITKEAQHAA